MSQLPFQFEFKVDGPPVSYQVRDRLRLQAWKDVVRAEAMRLWSAGQAPVMHRLQITVVYYHEGDEADIDNDNMLKPIQDALNGVVYIDDRQITDTRIRRTSIEGLYRAKAYAASCGRWLCQRHCVRLCARRGCARSCEDTVMDERGLTRPFDGETVEDVVREYEGEGFVVVRDPEQSQLPNFLAPFKPRLVAYSADGNGQKVVVEVMSRAELRKARYLPDLTGVVDAHEREGWRVDLYIIPPILAVDGDVQKLDRDEINARVDAVQNLLRSGQHDAALLLAWSVTEAALRQFARRESVPLKNERPLAVIATLYSVGLLSREDYDFLGDAKRARDVIVHGFRSPDLAPDFVLHLLEKVERRFQPVAA